MHVFVEKYMILRQCLPVVHLNYSTPARSGQSSIDHQKPNQTKLLIKPAKQSYCSNRARGTKTKQRIGKVITAEGVKVEGGISANM